MKRQYGVVEQSIKDLARIYKPSPAEVPEFVRQFEKKYKIPKGHSSKLRNIVRDTLGYKVSGRD